MKAPTLFRNLFFFSITICFLSCSESTLYYQGHQIYMFEKEAHPQLTADRIVSITPANIRDMLYSENEKIIWLLLLNYPCMKSVSEEVELYQKYSQHFQLFIITTKYHIGDMKRLEQEAGYPVYFISVTTDRAHANRKRFVRDIFGKDVSKEAQYATNIFVYRSRILHTAYSNELTEKTLSGMISD